MKKFAIAAASAALFVVPAAANAQAFVQAEAGVDNFSVQGDDITGFGYGVSAGYDLPLSGGMFVGVQGTFADSDAKECVSGVCAESGRDVAAVVRLGTAVGEKSKLYVLGGYANARLDINERFNGGVFGLRTDLDGFRLGAGYQYDLNDKFFVKAEYRYSNYEQDFSRHAGVLAVGTKF